MLHRRFVTTLTRCLLITAVLGSLGACSSMTQLFPWNRQTPPPVSPQVPPPETSAKPAPDTMVRPAPEADSANSTPPSPLPASTSSTNTPSAASTPIAAHNTPAKAKAHPRSITPLPPGAGTTHLVRGFYLNAGLFATVSNGDHAYRKLEAAGLPVFTEVVHSKTKGTLTRVRVGPYASKEQAFRDADTIEAMGMEVGVVEFAGKPSTKPSKPTHQANKPHTQAHTP